MPFDGRYSGGVRRRVLLWFLRLELTGREGDWQQSQLVSIKDDI